MQLYLFFYILLHFYIDYIHYVQYVQFAMNLDEDICIPVNSPGKSTENEPKKREVTKSQRKARATKPLASRTPSNLTSRADYIKFYKRLACDVNLKPAERMTAANKAAEIEGILLPETDATPDPVAICAWLARTKLAGVDPISAIKDGRSLTAVSDAILSLGFDFIRIKHGNQVAESGTEQTIMHTSTGESTDIALNTPIFDQSATHSLSEHGVWPPDKPDPHIAPEPYVYNGDVMEVVSIDGDSVRMSKEPDGEFIAVFTAAAPRRKSEGI